MRVLMFGAGVIGTIYGHVLSEAGTDVTHYVRPGKASAAARGIPLTLLDGRYASPQTTTSLYKAKRLIVRGLGDHEPTLANYVMWEGIVDPLNFVMERKMMYGLKERAEASAALSAGLN